ncbi:MAG: GtrA family protein [Mucinivorans sp.]
MMSRKLAQLIDFLYFPFLARFVPRDTFRYAAVGGINLVLNSLVYAFSFHILLQKADTHIIGPIVISAPIMSFLIAFAITFATGFWLTRTVAFGGSRLKGHIQLFRYCQVVTFNLFVNYFGVKLFVEICNFYPTLSNLTIQIITVGISYLASKYYTFRK